MRFNDFTQRKQNYDLIEKMMGGWTAEEIAEAYSIPVEEVQEEMRKYSF